MQQGLKTDIRSFPSSPQHLDHEGKCVCIGWERTHIFLGRLTEIIQSLLIFLRLGMSGGERGKSIGGRKKRKGRNCATRMKRTNTPTDRQNNNNKWPTFYVKSTNTAPTSIAKGEKCAFRLL